MSGRGLNNKNPGIKIPFLALPREGYTDETQSYCVTIPAGLEAKRLLVGYLLHLTKWFSWERDTEKRGVVVAQKWSKALNLPNLEECMGACCPETNSLLASLLRMQLEAKYAGNPTNMGSNVPDTSFGIDSSDITPEAQAKRINTLCYALTQLVDTLCGQYVRTAQAAGAAGGVVGTIVALIPGAEIIGGMIIVIATALSGVVAEACADKDARRELICYMNGKLRSQAVTFENFKQALDGFSGSTNADLIATALWWSLHDETNFAAFVKYLSDKFTSIGPDDAFCNGCSDCYSWEALVQTGTIISSGENWVEVQAVSVPAEGYNMIKYNWLFPDADLCCYCTAIEVTSGSWGASGTNFVKCDGSTIYNRTVIDEFFRSVEWYTTTEFTLKITFA